MAQCASPDGMGRKEGWGVYSLSRCKWCTATATFLLVVRVCSVCKRERGEIEGSVISTLARTRGLGVPKPGSSGLSQI